MRLKPRQQYVDSADLTFLSATGAATAVSRSVTIPNIGHPLDRIDLCLEAAVNTAGSGGTVAFSPLGLIELLKNIRLRRYPKNRTPENVIDASGPGLFEYGLQTVGLPSQSTLAGVAVGAAGVAAAAATYLMKVTIPLAHNQLADPLRMFTMLDIHNDSQAPTLTIDTAAGADIESSTTKTTFDTIKLHVWPTYREITPEAEKFIQDRGGYLRYDMIETTERSVAANATNSDPLKVPSPGLCSGLLVRSWSNTAGVGTRGEPGTAGARFQLKMANSPLREFTWREIANLNSESIGPVAYLKGAATNYNCMPAGSYYFDFITDSIGCDGSSDFGSVLAIPNAIDTSIAGTFGSTTATKTRLLLHRFYDDLSPARFAGAK